MLCSLSTKSAGKSTAGLSWLDRLRISRGFPLHHPDLDLDHFLLHPSNPSPNSILPSPPPHQPEDASPTLTDSRSREMTDDQSPGEGNQGHDEEDEEEKEKGKFFNLMSNALAELFRMDDPAEHKRIRDLKDRRNCRKQLNPKICVLPTSGGDGGTLSPPSAENSTVGAKKRLVGRKTLGKKRPFSNNGSKDPELEQQSRTEVTVIDTSCSPEWKSEKILFRKGNIWKIRDRISWNLSKKKKRRKLNSAERLTGGEENDQKYNEVDRNDALTAVSEHPRELVSKGIILDKNFAPQRRLHLSRSSHKPAIRDITISRPRKIPCKKRRNLPTEVALNCQCNLEELAGREQNLRAPNYSLLLPSDVLPNACFIYLCFVASMAEPAETGCPIGYRILTKYQSIII